MRAPLDNLGLKAASLALAILLWFVIAGQKTAEVGMQVPLELRNFPKDLELTGEMVNAVQVRLRASPGIVQQLAPGEVAAQIDLGGVAEGERIVHLSAGSIRVPFGVEVVKISPALLTLNFERTLQKVVPVRPRLTGRSAAGFEVAEVTSDPPEVRLAGPRSRVQEVESAFTEPISVEGAETSVVEARSLGLEDPLLRILGSTRVTVTARVRPRHDKRTFDGLALAVRGGTASVAPGRVRVVLEGPATALKQVQAQDVKPYVDVTNLAAAGDLPVAVELLPGFTGVNVFELEPARVSVRPLRKKG